jgi:hypothetical protein
MNVLVLNCGSSSLKFQVVATDRAAMEANTDRVLAHGVVERIGSEALLTLIAADTPPVRRAEPLRDHRAALEAVLRWLIGGEVAGIASAADVHAVGHRVVHGGEELTRATLLDERAIRTIEACIETLGRPLRPSASSSDGSAVVTEAPVSSNISTGTPSNSASSKRCPIPPSRSGTSAAVRTPTARAAAEAAEASPIHMRWRA